MKNLLLLIALFMLQPAYGQQKRYRLKGYTDSTGLSFSRTANCRMDCLKVSEADVRLVLKNGEATLGKPKDSASHDKIYIIEGDLVSRQKIRIIATPRGNNLFIISVLPSEKRIDCDCTKTGS